MNQSRRLFWRAPMIGVILALVFAVAPGWTAEAKELTGVINNVTLTGDLDWDGDFEPLPTDGTPVDKWINFRTEIDWCIPSGSNPEAGDTFTLQLPEYFGKPPAFDLSAGDGSVVATASVGDSAPYVITFTFTDYVEGHLDVCGSAWFESRLDEPEFDTEYTLEYVVDGQVVSSNTITTESFTPPPADQPRKWSSWEDDAQTQLKWGIETPNGPWDSTLVNEDIAGAGFEFVCSDIKVSLWKADAGPPQWMRDLDASDYTVDSCTPTAAKITLHMNASPNGEAPAGHFVRVEFLSQVVEDRDNYRNTVDVTVDDRETQSVTDDAPRTAAGGDGGGNDVPSIDIEKLDTDGNDADTEADAVALGLEPGSADLRFVITNDGNDDLLNVEVTDAIDAGNATVDGLTCDFNGDGTFTGTGPTDGPFVKDGAETATFEIDASFECKATLNGVMSDSPHANTATVTANSTDEPDREVTDSDSYHATAKPAAYDLAVRKTTEAGQVAVGDTVVFDVEVFNQGEVDSGVVTVTDTFPAGMSFVAGHAVNAGWTDNGDGTATASVDNVGVGGSAKVQIALKVDTYVAGGYVNTVEISDDSGDDVDSTTDTDPTNDALTDDVIDSTPTGNPADEDDHDIASVMPVVPAPSVDVEKFDAAGNDADTADAAADLGAAPASTTITLDVTNNGDEPLVDLVVSDVNADPAVGVTSAPDCDFDGDGALDGTNEWAGPLAVGESFTCTIELTGVPAEGIHSDTATVTGKGQYTGTTVTDDDPYHADAKAYDLAVRKTTEAGQVAVGDTVVFDVEVFNQGEVDSGVVTVADTFPAGMSFVAGHAVNAGWTDNGDGTATASVDNVGVGGSAKVQIALKVDTYVAGGYVNTVEISDDSGDDVDSTTDTDPTNDALTDDVIDSTPTGNPADEDDHDIASVMPVVPAPSVDVEKFDAAGNDADTADAAADLGAAPASTTITLDVTNNGDEPLVDLVVSDVNADPAVGVTSAPDCDFDGDGALDGTNEWAGPLAVGESFTCTIELTGVPAEGIHSDTATVTGKGQYTGTTVTDDDPYHADAKAYDLAVRKTTEAGQVKVGDTVVFDVEVFNQGEVDSGVVTVTDTFPAGMSFVAGHAVNAGWTDNGDGTATASVDNVAVGGSAKVQIALKVDTYVAGGYVNTVEISDDSGDDVDSTTDTDPTNDALTDDVIDSTPTGNPADEDDHDIAFFKVPQPPVTPPARTLPITGGSVAALLMIAFGLVAGGLVLMASRRIASE